MIEMFQIIAAIRFPDWISEDAISFGNFSIKWYGIAYVVSLFGAYLYAARIAETRKYWVQPHPTRGSVIVPTRDDLGDLMFNAFLGILIGGRLGYILFYSTDTIWTAPLDIFKIWQGGMSFHGGFLGVCAAVYLTSRAKKIEVMRLADITAIGAPLGPLLVRLTNFANQELWGRPTDLPWAMIFPKDPDLLPRHPSQLYEAFLEGAVLWLILRVLTQRGLLTRPGIMTGTFIAGYGVFRFAVEFVREPDATLFGPLTRGMAYSLPMVVVGLGIIIWAAQRKPVDPDYNSSRADKA